MKKLLIISSLVIIAFLMPSASFSQPTILWQKCFGGFQIDEFSSFYKTNDGGTILTGRTPSNDGDAIGNHGSSDALIIKLSSIGEIEWEKCFGGSYGDEAHSIIQTFDGGFAFAGSTNSYDGDVIINHKNNDIWFVKLDSGGKIQWQKCFGGDSSESAKKVIQTKDSGYVLACNSNSINGDIIGNHGSWDGVIIKLNSLGEKQWQKSIGGSDYDYLSSIQQTVDGGYILSGYTLSNDIDSIAYKGNYDAWIIKLNPDGDVEWQKCLGGSQSDGAITIIQTIDDGFIFVGSTSSFNGDVKGWHGKSDAWIVRLDSMGKIIWQKCLGGSKSDGARSIIESRDGDLVFAGWTESNDGDVSGIHSESDDYWVVKTNSTGDVLWQKCFGGNSSDFAELIIQTNENEYLVGGSSFSLNGDVTGSHDNCDMWIVKIADLTDIIENSISDHFISPNPATDFIEISNPPLETGSGGVSAVVFDILGEIQSTPVCSADTPGSGGQVRIDVSGLAPGMYFVRIGDKVSKFVKI